MDWVMKRVCRFEVCNKGQKFVDLGKRLCGGTGPSISIQAILIQCPLRNVVIDSYGSCRMSKWIVYIAGDLASI